MKRRPYTERLENAYRELLALIRDGAEFPDVDWKVADKHHVYRDDLVNEYDTRVANWKD